MAKKKEPANEVDKILKEYDINLKQKAFCDNFVSEDFYGNGVQSYIDAYNPDQSKPNWYATAKVQAHNLLTKINLLNYINSMIDASGLNDAHVDKQLVKLITQDADYTNKVAAIKEYNKLKQRIVDKSQINVIVEQPLFPDAKK